MVRPRWARLGPGNGEEEGGGELRDAAGPLGPQHCAPRASPWETRVPRAAATPLGAALPTVPQAGGSRTQGTLRSGSGLSV